MRIGLLLELSEEIRRAPFTGPANHVRQVFLGLRRLGCCVSLLCRLDGRLWLTDDLQEFRPVSVRKSDLGMWRAAERVLRRAQRWSGFPYLGFFESRRFMHACLQELSNCDLYYERFNWMCYGGGLAAARAGIPLVLEYNGDPLDDLRAKQMAPAGVQGAIARALTGRSLRGADHVVATGDGWRRNCVAAWRVPAERVSVVENGTDLVEILDRSALRAFRPLEGPGRAPRVVYLGGFYPWHGVDKLLRAAAALVRAGTHITVTLIGSGSGEAAARSLTCALGLEDQVTFTGRLAAADYAAVLADSDIGVSPYCGWQEYSGLKIFDYKAAGLACVASGEGGRPSSIRHGRTGWIVPPCSESALAEALALLAADARLRRRLGRAARLEAERRHAWEHSVRQLMQIFERVTADGRAAAGTLERTRLAGSRRMPDPA